MDPRTLDYYALNAADVAVRYEATPSPLRERFASLFPPGGRILDIGCGSGRDLAELARQGFRPHGVDGTADMVELAQSLHPELRGAVALGRLPDLPVPFGGEFDGVLCSAVLMHVDSGDLLNAAMSIKRCLKAHGSLLISVPGQRPDVDGEGRDSNGRLFRTYPPGYLRLIFERLGFTLVDQWKNADAMGRNGIEWTSFAFRLKSAANSRPIDQIEGVLNHDRKSATYKFALFRSLSEIATQSPASVCWRPDGMVGLPVRQVAEKWLQYYWPLIASATFIPQLNGEKQDRGKPIKFRTHFTELVSRYAGCGGYSAFRIERNKDILPTDSRQLLHKLMADIEAAIINGPVRYAGGALNSGRIFGHDPASKHILIPEDLWIELSHLGYWISQAVVLQWAEKTSRLSDEMTAAGVIDLLLYKEDSRSTGEARKFFSAMSKLECVWSGASLHQVFDIDHVIPFDLWHNNDSWNLLPSSRKANNAKRNKLPSGEILKRRKDCIVHYWEILRENNPLCFEKEASTLVSIREKSNWQNGLFGELCHAIEVTALQRGVGRWNGTH